MSAAHDTLPWSVAATGPTRPPAARDPHAQVLELTWPVHRRGAIVPLVWQITIELAPGDAASSIVRSWTSGTAGALDAPHAAHPPATLELVGRDLWHLSIPAILSAIIRRPPNGPATLLYAQSPALADPSIPEGGVEQPSLSWRES